MIDYLLANSGWTLANAAAYWCFRRALRDPRRAQEDILFRFLRRNAGSDYGRRYGYARLRSVRQFQEAVPIVGYDDLGPWIEQVCRGRPNVLTTEPVRFVETTSGSTSAVKYVPYTAALLREFRRAIGAWMFDLFTHRPALLGGAQYWSISPSARQAEVTPGGLRVGIDDDREYLGLVARLALGRVLAVPASVARAPDLDSCRRQTLKHLMRCRNLRFISVWNPSFLTLLVDGLPAGTRPRDWWPGLRLISCWTSAASARFLPELRDRFPGVEIQGKGLLATEGVVSFPLVGRPAPAPALTSHFLEFIDEQGRIRLADELEPGRRYRVLITTGGGLARYDLGDQIEVVAPGAIEFVGRGDAVSDLCGEKLSEGFVGRVLEEVSAEAGFVGFALLAPEWSRPPHYLLFAETDAVSLLAERVEQRLRSSVHYDYCRRLGQLGPLEGVRVYDGAARYLRGGIALGQRAGSIKSAWLRREPGWRQWLAPETVAADATAGTAAASGSR